jgi:hypothetical protein
LAAALAFDFALAGLAFAALFAAVLPFALDFATLALLAALDDEAFFFADALLLTV